MSTRFAKEVNKKERIAQIRVDIKKEEAALKALLAEDRTPYAQGIVDRMFAEFKRGAAWTNKMKEYAEKKYYVFSPIGRKRNLFAALTEDKAIVARQVRRGTNAPIQGFASEIGVKAGRVVFETYYTELPKLCELMGIEYDPWELRIPYNRIVHDASYYAVPFHMVIPFVHILQYDTTYGITKRYKDEFGVTFEIEPEIEIEFGARDDGTHGWDWSIPSIVQSCEASLQDMIDMKILKRDKKKVMREIFAPWKDKKCRHYLQDKFPLLNVTDLDKQIVSAIAPIYN